MHLVGGLKGGFKFMSDLVRAMGSRVTLDFIAVSRYAKSTKSSGEVRLVKDLDSGLEGRHVIIVEDIVDTGLTLTYLQDILRARAPKTLKTACLLSKPSRRKVDVVSTHRLRSGWFVVGYGLDYASQSKTIAVLDGVSSPSGSSGSGRAGARIGDVGWPKANLTPLAKDTLAARRITVVPAG